MLQHGGQISFKTNGRFSALNSNQFKFLMALAILEYPGIFDCFTTLLEEGSEKIISPALSAGINELQNIRRFSALNFKEFEFLMALALRE